MKMMPACLGSTVPGNPSPGDKTEGEWKQVSASNPPSCLSGWMVLKQCPAHSAYEPLAPDLNVGTGFVLLTFCYLKTLMSESMGRFFFAAVKPLAAIFFILPPMCSQMWTEMSPLQDYPQGLWIPQGNILEGGMRECPGLKEMWVWVLLYLLASWPSWRRRFLIHKNGDDCNLEAHEG